MQLYALMRDAQVCVAVGAPPQADPSLERQRQLSAEIAELHPDWARLDLGWPDLAGKYSGRF